MTLRPVGEARVSGVDPDDVLLMSIGGDLLSVRLDHLRQLVNRNRISAPICRRYLGTAGRFLDTRIYPEVRRTRRGRGLTFRDGGRIYVMPTEDIVDVINSQERHSAVGIYEIIIGVDQLSDTNSKQTALGAF
ncbi:MAG: hypothetical protein WC277_12850 [Bacilli bacterium]|jgi:hypothetical protein